MALPGFCQEKDSGSRLEEGPVPLPSTWEFLIGMDGLSQVLHPSGKGGLALHFHGQQDTPAPPAEAESWPRQPEEASHSSATEPHPFQCVPTNIII